ncbi:MAG: uroporphyrinogen-III synthase [Bradyrhizobium sp.]|nr:MAG: uroporphyrinogen-III synthase [Bradyrhizobium sp.]
MSGEDKGRSRARGAVQHRIALMRARDEAETSAAQLAAHGLIAVLAPATEIRLLASALPVGSFDALIVTSPRAIAALAVGDRARLAGLPLHAVGERAAGAARAAGLAPSGETAADSAALAARLAASFAPGARLLYLAGRERRPELEAALAAAGHRIVAVALYSAEARDAWSRAEAEGVAACDAALHYSHRSAALAVALAERAGIGGVFRAMLHVCLSQRVAEPLAAFGASRIACSDAPNEARLIAALEQAFGGAA